MSGAKARRWKRARRGPGRPDPTPSHSPGAVMSSIGPKRYDAFLSYNSQDRPAVHELADRLKGDGLVLYLEEWELAPGREFQPALAEGQTTVGTRVDMRHLAATPVGMQVTATAELVEVDGRRLRFRIQAHDRHESVAEGIHERAIVDRARWLVMLPRTSAAGTPALRQSAGMMVRLM